MGKRVFQATDMAAIRGERLVFGSVSFALAPGAALLLVGPNGSGKSTLLRILAGLGRLASGTLQWDGADALADRSLHATRLAYLGHLDAIKPGLTAAENAGRESLAAMNLMPLADLPARMLSAGQKRRLALARLLANRAPLWLLDEPTLGLDAASVERLGAALAAHRARGGMLVAATHLPLPLPGAQELALL